MNYDEFNNTQMRSAYNYLDLCGNILFAKSGIKIKKENRGKFTEYCNGKVTNECIDRAKHSSSATIRKRATFAENARKWAKKGKNGMYVEYNPGDIIDPEDYNFDYMNQDLPGMYDIIRNNSTINRPTVPSEDPVEEPESFEITSQPNFVRSVTEAVSSNLEASSSAKYWSDYKKNNLAEILQNAQHIYDRLRETGFSKTGAQAILANLWYESAGTLNPKVLNFSGGGDTGIAQWVGSRKTRFKKMYDKDLKDATLDELLDYLVWEINNGHSSLIPGLKQEMGSVREAVAHFLPFESGNFDDAGYERVYHHTKSWSIDLRTNNFKKLQSKLNLH